MTGPLPSELPSPAVRRLPTCFLCPRPAVRVFGTEGMVDLDRDGLVYACARHPLVIDLDAPPWAHCSAAFCSAAATMGLRHVGPVRLGGRLWVIFACGSREHALYDFDLVPVELR